MTTSRWFPWLLVLVALPVLAGCADKTTTTTQTTNLDITNLVEIKTAYVPDATEGVAYNQPFLVVGGAGTYTWSLDTGGINDSWLSIDASGVLSGTPTISNVGDVRVIVRVADTLDPLNFDLQSFDFYVQATPSSVRITTGSVPNAWVANSWGLNLQAEGGSGNYIWTKLPTGTNDNWVTVYSYGYVGGVPSMPNVGPVTLRVRLTDANDTMKRVSVSYTFNVYSNVIAITNPTPLPSAAISNAYSIDLTATGGSGGYLWAIEPGGTNDSWLSLDSGTGALSGSAPGSAQVVTFTVSCTDTEKPAITTMKTFNLAVKTLAIQTERLPAAFVGLSYAQSMTAAGGMPPYTWNVEPGGSNYSWLSFASDSLQNATGPTTTELGAVKVIVKASDGTNSDARLFQTTVFNLVNITSTTLADAYVGVGYSQVPGVTGGTGSFLFTIEAGGTNDGWLTIDEKTGRLSGTPTSANLGTTQVIVKATEKDYSSVYDQETITIQVKGVTITTATMPDANLSVAYTYNLIATGGSGYYAWSASTIPAWMTLNPDTGQVTGTPTTTGTCTLTVTVYDPLDPLLTDTRTFVFWVVNYLLVEDFATTSAPAGWSWSGQWYIPHYHYGNYCGPYPAYNGSYSAGSYYYGSYWAGYSYANCYLRTPACSLPSMSSTFLTFYMWLQCDINDGMQVLISTDGVNFTQLTPQSPAYTGTSGGVSAWTGYNTSFYDYGWRKCLFDLSAWAGNTVYIRWAFNSDYNGIQGPSWAIDAIRVFSLSSTGLLPRGGENPIPGIGMTYAPPESSDYTSGVNLSWDAGTAATSYDVYVGTSQAAVASATTTSAEFMGNQVGVSYSATTLTAGNTYYWRVDAVNSNGTTSGPVWNFTTANPVKVLVNEVQFYGGGGSYGPYTEIYNPNTTITQEITGWDLNLSYSGTSLQTYVFPSRILLAPQAARAVAWHNFYYHSYSPYRMWDVVYMPMNPIGWYYGYYACEAWLRNPSAVGQDYWGVNVSTSNRPSDLNWTNPLSQGSSMYTIWRRTSNTDNDSGSDWRNDYYYYYGSSYGYMGLKDYGQ